MAEITRHRQGEMIQAVFKVLADKPDGLPAREVIREVEGILPPTPFELSEYPASPGTRRYDKILRFSTIGPVKAGWLVKNKGTWLVSDDGLAALTKFTDPADLMRESHRLYRKWRKSQPTEDETDDGSGDVQDDQPHPSVTLEEADETARQEIRDHLAKMPPYDVQDLVAALLQAMGYHVAWVAPPGPDKGVDIVAYTDPMGASGPRIKVQVKRRADKIAVAEIRSFFAVLGNADVGIFVCLGGFSSEAQSEARNQEVRRISLLDADGLIDLWVEHYERIPESSRQFLPLKPIYYLAPV
jgi:restriction system protein